MQNYQNRYIFTSQLLKSWSIWYGGDKCSIQNKLHLFHYRIYECYGLGIRIFLYLLKLTAALSRTLSVVFADSAQLQGGGGGLQLVMAPK